MYKSTFFLHTLIFLSLLALFSSEENLQGIIKNDKVTIKVYYETLCPGSVRFITSQLRPTIQKLAAHLDVQMVPYGNAKTLHSDDHHVFSCQHGAAECYGNKLHACVIDDMKNGTQAALFNACLMQNTVRRPHVGYDYRFALNWCEYEMNHNVEDIRDCVNSDRGSQLLNSHGKDTKQQLIKYVPYLMVNGHHDLDGSAVNNLMATVCNILQPMPKECL